MSKSLLIRMSQAEHDALRRLAEHFGVSVATIVRWTASREGRLRLLEVDRQPVAEVRHG
jgi:hypothetical protein